jgi:hypothetical protein
MEMVFNELSFRPYVEDKESLKRKFMEMLNTYSRLKEEYRTANLLFPSGTANCKVSAGTTFFQWVSSLTNTSEKNKILLATTRKPFGEDILEADKNSVNRYYYENDEASITQEYCPGLAICHLKDRIAVSLHSHCCWEPSKLSFKEIVDDDFRTKDVEVFNVCESGKKLDGDLSWKLLYYGKVKPPKSNIPPQDKKVKLSGDHHGNDKLRAFAEKLLQSKYVLRVIDSIRFRAAVARFIKTIYPDGTIDVVLYWEDAGYGMKIKTTGRNYRETEVIADILKKEFDR